MFLSRRDTLKLFSMSAAVFFGPRFIRQLSIDEKDETLPKQFENVTLNFLFVEHTQATDLEGFDESLRECDVCIPEWLGWKPENEVLLNNVSLGLVSPKKVQTEFNNEFLTTLSEKISKSNKLIKILDVPAGNLLFENFHDLAYPEVPNYNQSYTTRVHTLRSRLQKEADWQRNRENYILEQMLLFIPTINKTNLIKNNGNLKILLEYGVSHTRLLHLASRQPEVDEFSSKYPLPRFSFLHSDEARRRFWFAMDRNDPKHVDLPDNKLMMHVVMERLLDWFFIPNLTSFENTAVGILWFRDVVEKFGRLEPEVSDMWEYQRMVRQDRTDLDSSDLLPELRTLQIQLLREKGIGEEYIQKAMSHLHTNHSKF